MKIFKFIRGLYQKKNTAWRKSYFEEENWFMRVYFDLKYNFITRAAFPCYR